MSNPRTRGRMINKAISNSHKFAALSAPAAVLFCMIIPHLNSHGKMNGGTGYIKDEICPIITYLSLTNIPKFLKEINDNTGVKWFEFDGRHWIHSVNFLTEHQTLDSKKLGLDLLPTYSGLTPIQVRHEVEVEVEEKTSPFDNGAEILITLKKRQLSGKRLEAFVQFWDAFDYKTGKAAAADSWLDIPLLTMADMVKILKAAKIEATRRPKLIADGKTPKMAQGWLSGRRWEDEAITESSTTERYN